MGKKIPRITNSEMQILEVLWDEGEALTSSEIVEVSDDRTWKSSSVHLLLNSLLKKKFVQVAGFKNIHTGKIDEVMLIKNHADLDAFKKMYGIDGEIEKVY